jgi:predicted MFS family arabinose efflux permease
MSAFSVANIIGIYAGLEIAESFGWRGPFAALTVLCMPTLLLAWRVLPPVRGHLGQHRTAALDLRQVVFHPAHLRAYALTSALMLGSWTIIPFLAIFLVNNLHWAEVDLRWVWLCGGVATLLTMTPTGWVADSHDKLLVFRVIGLASLVPVLLLTNLPPATSIALTLLATTLFMVVTSLRWVPAMALLTASVAPAQRGSFMSVNASVQQLIMGLGPLVSGVILGANPETDTEHTLHGFGLVGVVAAASMLASVVLAGRLRRAPDCPPELHVHATVAEPLVNGMAVEDGQPQQSSP